MDKVQKIKQAVKEQIKQIVIRKMITNIDIQNVIEDIDNHFVPEYNWSLSYETYKNHTGLDDMEFNIFLELLNCKLRYAVYSGVIVFRPREK